MSFDLMVEPWLPVMFVDGRLGEVGLEGLFEQAHRIRRIVGETPPMTAALHRTVLALACRVYQPVDFGRWKGLWQDRCLPVDELAEYRREHPRSFDLFDEERPFLQCPAVATAAASTAAKLVPYRSVGNNTTLFDHTTAKDVVTLTPAEAARWLVTLQAYDPGGMKTPYRKDKSSVSAPANDFGMVLVEGGDLKETLLLNLIPYDPGRERPRTTLPSDRPAWEADPPGPEPAKRAPEGWTDLLTWPARRAWLGTRRIGTEIVVDRVVVTPGTRLDASLEDNEWMAAHQRPLLRMSKKAHVYGPWRPLSLRGHRGVWRHSQELFFAPASREEWHQQRPAALDHVDDMVDFGAIPEDAVYTLRVFGQQLDANRTVVEQVFEETVVAPVALLRARHQAAHLVIGRAIELTNSVGGALHKMERDYRADLSGSQPAKSRKPPPPLPVDLAYWPALAAPFDQFLRTLAIALESGESPAAAAETWAGDVHECAHRVASRWAEDSSRQGRTLQAAARCHGVFLGQLTHFVRVYRAHLAGATE